MNKENDEITVPYYAYYDNNTVGGFFGSFRFLSNFYILENGIWYEELSYPSVEHAYQAAKWPHNQREKFLTIPSWKAKHLGKESPNFNKKKWDKIKLTLMSAFVYQKFSKNTKLKKMLYMTEDAKLEERNNWGDQYWGTDINGVGENHLGKILMDVRDKLKLEEKNELF